MSVLFTPIKRDDYTSYAYVCFSKFQMTWRAPKYVPIPPGFNNTGTIVDEKEWHKALWDAFWVEMEKNKTGLKKSWFSTPDKPGRYESVGKCYKVNDYANFVAINKEQSEVVRRSWKALVDRGWSLGGRGLQSSNVSHYPIFANSTPYGQATPGSLLAGFQSELFGKGKAVDTVKKGVQKGAVKAAKGVKNYINKKAKQYGWDKKFNQWKKLLENLVFWAMWVGGALVFVAVIVVGRLFYLQMRG